MTSINDTNFHHLVLCYCYDKTQLPADLQNKKIGTWDVSRVTDMSGRKSWISTFRAPKFPPKHKTSHVFSEDFDEPLNEWDVSNVTDMYALFSGCETFNQPLGTWNVSNVTRMEAMFYDCQAFNQPIGNWDVRKVEDMNHMFSGCEKFNKPLHAWKVGNVTTMEGMFEFCKAFNQPLDNWNVSNVTDMQAMFFDCNAFDQPLNNWDITHVTSDSMFEGCRIRASYRPGYVSPQDSKQQLDTFYRKQGIDARKCNDAVICPITQIRLKHLQKLKRVVALDGRCYAFYAFIHPTQVLTSDPINRKDFSPEAIKTIATLRKYKDYLNSEFDGLPPSTFDDTPTPSKKRPTPSKTTPRSSRARSMEPKSRKTRSLSLPPLYSRKSRKIRSI